MKIPDLNRDRLFWLALGGLGLLWLALTTLSIEVYPSPARDEVVWGAVAANFLRTGNFGIDIWPDHYGSSRNYISVGWIFILYLAGIFKLFGIGLAQARWGVAVATLASGLCLALGLRKLYSAAHGLIAAALYLFSWNMFYHSHYVRPEPVSLLGSLGLFYWLIATRDAPSMRVAFGWGLINGLLLDTHLSAIHLLIAVDAVIVVDALRRRSWRRVLWLGLGHALSLLYWLGAHLLPDPLLALKQYAVFSPSIAPSAGFGPGLFGRILAALYNFRGQFLTLTRLSAFQFVWMLIGGAIVIRHWRRHWLVVLPTVSLFATLIVVIPASFHGYYLFILVPWLSAVMAVAAGEWFNYFGQFQSGWRRWLRWGYGGALGLLFASYLAGSLVLTWSNRTLDYKGLGTQLTRLAPANANVIADAIWFYTYHAGKFSEYPFVFADVPNFSSAARAQQTLAAFFADRQIEYVLLNENAPYLLYSEFEDRHTLYVNFVTSRCRYVGRASGDLYGVEVGVSYREMRVVVYDCRPAASSRRPTSP
jgi:hypothetical protein